MSINALLPILLGLFGLGGAFYLYGEIKKYPGGEGKIARIAEQIHIGAMVFMRREYQVLGIFCAVIIVLIQFSDLGWKTALSFIVGALTSALAGFIGMYTSTKANVRTAIAASTEGVSSALTVAFFWWVSDGLDGCLDGFIRTRLPVFTLWW